MIGNSEREREREREKVKRITNFLDEVNWRKKKYIRRYITTML